MIGEKDEINTDNIKDDKHIKLLKKITSNLSNELENITKINFNKELDFINVSTILKEFKKIEKDLKELEFNSPYFLSGESVPQNLIKSCTRFKNEFKEIILGKLERLIEKSDAIENLKEIAKKI